MQESYSQLLLFEVKNAFIFLIAMLVTSGIAFYKGFYKLDKEEKIKIRITYVFSIFFIYLFISLVVGPLAVKLLKSSITKSNAIAFTFALNLSISLLIIGFLSLFCFKVDPQISNEIIKKKISQNSSKN